MLADIFYWVLNMSISAAIMGFVVLILTRFKRIPRNIACVLWAIPFIRMWVPVGMGSRYSLMSFISKFTTKTVTVYSDPNVTMTNHIMAADSYFPITYKVDRLESVFKAGSVIWMIVFLVLILALVSIYLNTMRELKDSEYLRDNIYISKRVNTPAVYGVFKPKIIIPSEVSEYVLMHERVHIKRLDNMWRILAIITACVHWFNPLSWLYLKIFLSDTELACDEAVIKRLSDEDKKQYALTLLDHTVVKTVYASPFGGVGIKVRVERILSYRRLSALSITGFVLLVFTVAYVLLTNSV